MTTRWELNWYPKLGLEVLKLLDNYLICKPLASTSGTLHGPLRPCKHWLTAFLLVPVKTQPLLTTASPQGLRTHTRVSVTLLIDEEDR